MKHHTLSRTAERIYWLGRYLERAENTARVINSHANLIIDLPERLPHGWRPLLDMTDSYPSFRSRNQPPTERNVVRHLTINRDNPGSLANSLNFARENARTVRENMPRVSFEYINDLYLYARSELSGALSRSRRNRALEGVLTRVQQIDGFLSRSMLHNEAWSFLRLGQFIERGDMTTRIIGVAASTPLAGDGPAEPYHQLQWRSVLRSLHAMQSYRVSVQEPVSQPLTLDFLLKNPDLPRSLTYSLDSIRNSLRRLPRCERPLRACNRARRNLKQADVGALDGSELLEFIDTCQLHLAQLHDFMGKTYFNPRLRVPKAGHRGPDRHT
jgi:uncharacterized alpha-E superfamily protein